MAPGVVPDVAVVKGSVEKPLACVREARPLPDWLRVARPAGNDAACM